MVFCALFCAWSVFVTNQNYEVVSQKVYMFMAHFVNCVGTSVYFMGKKYFKLYNAEDKPRIKNDIPFILIFIVVSIFAVSTFLTIQNFTLCITSKVKRWNDVSAEINQRMQEERGRLWDLRKKKLSRCTYEKLCKLDPRLGSIHKTCCICLLNYQGQDEVTIQFCTEDGHGFHA